MILKVIFANNVDPDQTAPLGRSSLIRVHTICLYAKIGLKSLQEYSADDISDAGFLGFKTHQLLVKWTYSKFWTSIINSNFGQV